MALRFISLLPTIRIGFARLTIVSSIIDSIKITRSPCISTLVVSKALSSSTPRVMTASGICSISLMELIVLAFIMFAIFNIPVAIPFYFMIAHRSFSSPRITRVGSVSRIMTSFA